LPLAAPIIWLGQWPLAPGPWPLAPPRSWPPSMSRSYRCRAVIDVAQLSMSRSYRCRAVIDVAQLAAIDAAQLAAIDAAGLAGGGAPVMVRGAWSRVLAARFIQRFQRLTARAPPRPAPGGPTVASALFCSNKPVMKHIRSLVLKCSLINVSRETFLC